MQSLMQDRISELSNWQAANQYAEPSYHNEYNQYQTQYSRRSTLQAQEPAHYEPPAGSSSGLNLYDYN